jgi:hypothetical protein
MNHTVTESIFSGANVIVPMADVQHIEKHKDGIMVVTKHTRWDCDHDVWANGIWMSEPEATNFRRAWCSYRSELEADTLMDLTPTTAELMKGFDNAIDAIKRA